MRRVLIVDDKVSILKLLKEKFEREGLLVLTATNADEGVRNALEAQPDLIILDVGLSETGDSLTERFRDDPRTAHIPLILLSTRENLAREGAWTDCLFPHVYKPFRPSQLLALAREHL